MNHERPNIILINCDDLGYGDLGCYGSTANRTPNLDRMAAEGIRFTDFYMASPVCSPSRGAMMTGCYPPRIGFGEFGKYPVLFPGSPEGLNPDEHTIASLLKTRGYATMAVGKWHCGDQPPFLPTRHGFDHYFGLPYSNDMGRQAGREQHMPPLPLLQDEEILQQQPDQAGLTERYVEKSVGFLRENKDRPFFLYLAHMYVHLPIYAPERFLRESVNGRYGAGVECVDWATGVLLDELKRLGIDGNTLVLFTSDNGSRGQGEGGSNAPLRGGKGSTWEGGMRLPLLARWPDRIPAGVVCGEVAASLDFLPTFTLLAGGTPPEDRVIDGKNILPLLLGEPGALSPHEAFFYYRRNQLEAVRSGRWKLHFRRLNETVEELYDLEMDIGETTNLSAKRPEVVARLEDLAAACRVDLGDSALGIQGANVRPCGRVENPRPLTEYDPSHPYIIHTYDLSDAG